MTDGTDLKGMIADEVSNQVGVGDLLGDGSIEDEVDAGEIGAAVGRQFGESLGREIGASIGRNVHEALATELAGTEEDAEGDEHEGEGEGDDETGEPLRTTVTTAVRDGVSEAFEDSSVREPLESVADSATGETDLLGEEAAEEEAAGEGAEPDEPEQPTEEAEEPTETDEDEGEAEAEDGPSADELEDLRRETLEDFLGVMSYEDLQSVAKDVDVKANLSREEMTEEIIEAVTGEESEGSDGDDGDDEEEADATANAE
ncbi:hypothetical protein [Natronobacterium haloterrestre]|uniref:hypothetical protein n=1 Tax=Natronobacterium haloterrestre TaxID=148448 RepID=UPI000B7E27BA|nr:hypothetical protein [Halobiforma haloterrestris]